MAKGSGTTKASTKSNPRGLSGSASYTEAGARKLEQEFNANVSRFGTSAGTYANYWRVENTNNGYKVSITDRGNSLDRKVESVAKNNGFEFAYNKEESDSFSSVYYLTKKKK